MVSVDLPSVSAVAMAARRESLWKNHFEDPSQWGDNRDSKLRPRSPDYKPKVTKHSSWLDGCTTAGWVEEELNRRGLEGHDGSSQNIVRLLKLCTTMKDIHKGSKLHENIRKHNYLWKNIYIGNTLVSMYAKCGALAKAYQVLKELPRRNIVSWNAIIAGYMQHGQGKEALKCFNDMIHDGQSPDAITYICVLKACGSIRAVAKGEEIHDNIVNSGMLEKDVALGNALVDMYAKSGELAKAHRVLKELPMCDVVSWSVLIAGYTQHGQGEEALKCFHTMLCNGHSPDVVTYTSVLRACGSIGAAVKGEEIHDKIVSLGMLEKDVLLGNMLVDMYTKCSQLSKAHWVLKELPMRDAVSWNALIAGYIQHGQGEEALKCFDDMLCDGVSTNSITYICVLKACGSIGAAAKGKEIHDRIVSLGMLEKDVVLGNALVDMYAKSGELAKAHRVLKELPMRDVVSWGSLIAGYTQHGQGEEALKCFDAMLCDGHSPNVVTFICVLKACGSIRAAARGKEIHEQIASLGILEKDVVLGNTLLGMYAKCSEFTKAMRVLEELPMRDVVSWSVLVTGYMQHGQGEEALNCFNAMLYDGQTPDVVTYTCALKACGSIGAAVKGEEIHDEIVSLGMLDKDVLLGNTLVDMYAKCGQLAKAHQVLKDLSMRDAVSWNALIAGYTQHGQGEEVLKCFDDMLCDGVSPNAITYICVLKARANIEMKPSNVLPSLANLS